jgi:hypothetical protein
MLLLRVLRLCLHQALQEQQHVLHHLLLLL